MCWQYSRCCQGQEADFILGQSVASGNNTKHTQEPTSRCQTNGAAVCTLIANENIRDLHPNLVGDTEANSPLLEPIGRVPDQKKRS